MVYSRAVRRRLALSLLVPVIGAALLGGCGSSHASADRKTGAKRSQRPAPKYVDIYSSLPLHGPRGTQGRAVEAGIKLAMMQPRRAGPFQIRYIPLDDTARVGKKRHRHYVLSDQRVYDNASTAATNPNAVVYIGDLDSSATEISLPELNTAGIAQITPGSGYVDLADAPTKSLPSGQTTLLRLIPNDDVQAAAILNRSSTLCSRVAIVSLSDPESVELAKLVALGAREPAYRSLTIIGQPYSFKPGATAASIPTYTQALTQTLKTQTVGCFVIIGHTSSFTVKLADMLNRFAPNAYIIGSSALCNPGWTNVRRGGVGVPVSERLFCVSPILPLDRYPGAAQLTALYQRQHPHQKPSPYVLYGYAAAKLAIQAITALKQDADNRVDILDDLLFHDHTGVLGSYSFIDGNIVNTSDSSSTYGIFEVNHGNPELLRTVRLAVDQ